MATDPIKHVVVLMLENHSFDQMLGAIRSEFPDLEGVDPAHPGSNRDKDGRAYSQAVTTATAVRHDPMHELANVLHQLEGDNGNFVLDYSEAYPATIPDERQQIMGYFGPGSLPALHELARHFTICDHWYSSVPGPAWANRFFVHGGTSLGRVRMPEDWKDGLLHPSLYFGYDQTTIYDRLNEAGKSWKRLNHLWPSMSASWTMRSRHALIVQVTMTSDTCSTPSFVPISAPPTSSSLSETLEHDRPARLLAS